MSERQATGAPTRLSIGWAIVAALAPVLVLATGCASRDVDEEEEAASAVERAIGFDGAIVRLDEAALERVDLEARDLEARGASAKEVEKLASQRVLLEAKNAVSPTRGATDQVMVQGLYELGLPRLNDEERELCGSARLVCVRVLLSALRARSASRAEYSDGETGGRIDAFRHTYWNALMASSVGDAHAKAWGDAHENGYPENRATAAAKILSAMDFFNNAEGRRIGAAGGDLRKAVRVALVAGELQAVRYDRGVAAGVLVPTSECTDEVRCGR